MPDKKTCCGDKDGGKKDIKKAQGRIKKASAESRAAKKLATKKAMKHVAAGTLAKPKPDKKKACCKTRTHMRAFSARIVKPQKPTIVKKR